MSAPATTLGTIGNLIAAATSLAAGKNIGAPMDASALWEAQVSAIMLTGGTVATTAGVVVAAYKTRGSKPGSPNTTLNGTVTAGSTTSIAVVSAAGIQAKQLIAFYSPSNKKGELVVVTSISSNTLTIPTTAFSYASGDEVYLINMQPNVQTQLAPTTVTAYSTATCYGAPSLLLPTGVWWIAATNLDATNAVTVTIDDDTIASVG